MHENLKAYALTGAFFMLQAIPSCVADGPGEAGPLTSQYVQQMSHNLELNSLSQNASVDIKFVLMRSGNVLIDDVKSRNGSKSDAFYCEEDIWNTAPFPFLFSNLSTKHFDRTIALSKFDCQKLYFDAHPEQRNSSVVMHIIPLSVQRLYPKLFREDELHSLGNLIAVPISAMQSKALRDYHTEFADFLTLGQRNITVSRNDTINEVLNLLDRYKTAFGPRLDEPLKMIRHKPFENRGY